MKNSKTISKKQFETAVKHVLSGGNSKIVYTREEMPFSWSRSKGHMNLRGSVPENSKFLRNDGQRNGADKDVYLVAYLNDGYSIELTKAEILSSQRKENNKAKLARKKRQELAKKLANKAKKLGFKSIAEMKRRQSEIDEINRNNFAQSKKEQIEKFEREEGREFDGSKLTDRVRLSRIELVFERMDDII